MSPFSAKVCASIRDYWWIMALYVLSSFIQMFPLVSFGLLLIGELGTSAAEVTFYYTAIFVPWNFRAVFGLISDTVPVFGYRRKAYLIMSYVGVSCCFIAYGQAVRSLSEGFVTGVILNLFFVFSESIVDALAVDLVNKEPLSNMDAIERQRRSTDIQSAAMTFRTIGSLISGLIAGGLSVVISPRTIISMTSVFPALGAIIILFVNVERSGAAEIVNEKTRRFLAYMKECITEKRLPVDFINTVKPVILPCIFIFLYACSPSSSVPFTNYLYTELKFSSEACHAILLCGTIGSLCGSLIYWKAFRKSRDVRKGFIVSVIISVFAASSRILVIHGWNSIYFVCADELIVNMAFRLTLMPVQVYGSIAASAPQHLMFEGFVFGLFASIENWGGTVSGIISAVLSKHLSLTNLIIVAACLALVPLLALSLLKSPPTVVEPKLESSDVSQVDNTDDVNAV
jgi:hypothetical protein